MIAGLSLLLAPEVYAVKAKPGLVDYVQPDGTSIRIQLVGDEFSHYTLSADGHLLILNDKETYEYAVLGNAGVPVLSGVSASLPVSTVKGRLAGAEDVTLSQAKNIRLTSRSKNIAKESVSPGDPKYRFASCAFPPSGTPHSIVVLVEYPDYRFSMSDPNEYYEDFLNGDNFTRDKGTGSCRQYFMENSAGQFQPTFDVYGPVMMKYNRRYYGAGQEIHASEMVVEAVEFLDATVDFSQYDHNDDGYVDSIFIIYAERGEADGGPSESVWPHSWELEEAGLYVTVDGVKVNSYGCSNELDGGSLRPTGIGTFVHEFCHVLGLPDLYNTNSSSDDTTPGDWSVLDAGPYNGDGRTPPNMSSFERYSLGWLSPEEIVSSGELSLGALPETNKAYIMTTEENPDEFFIMDYRLQEGWDAPLPYHGMLIWHVDFQQRKWDYNEPNNDRRHQCVDLVRADDIKTSKSAINDPFPGQKQRYTEFSTKTTPALLSWDGDPLNVTGITDIREENRSVVFTATVTEDRTQSSGLCKLPSDEVDFSISGNNVICTKGRCDIYDISGRRVGIATPDIQVSLMPGLYIIQGSKILIK